MVCPMCGATPAVGAKKCTACGELLYGLAGDVSLEAGIYRDGDLLVMHKDAQLPYRCIKTNNEATTRLKRTLYWHTPALYLMVVFPGLLFYVLVSLIVRQKAVIQVPLGPEASSTRSKAILVGWTGVMGGIAMIVVGIIIADGQNIAGMFTILGGLGTIIVFGLATNSRSSIVSPARITKKHAWLRGVNPEYLAQFPEWSADFS